jgi:hypothetical protein
MRLVYEENANNGRLKYRHGYYKYADTFEFVLHREGGPAKETIEGLVSYYIHGKLHREDGPAIISPSELEEYYMNGVRHRLNGPAVSSTISSISFWYYHGKFIDVSSQAEFEKEIKYLNF